MDSIRFPRPKHGSPIFRDFSLPFALPNALEASFAKGERLLLELPCLGIYPGFIVCLKYMNYGILLTPVFIAFYESFKRGPGFRSQILCGIILAFMMIKPQIAALFFIPLIASKRFLSVTIAALILALATLWPAWVYKESPIDLILQIQQSGKAMVYAAPYLETIIFNLLNLAQNGRPSPAFITSFAICCALICTALSFLLRHSSSYMTLILPALFVGQFWTYINPVDYTLFWPLYFFFTMTMLNHSPLLLHGCEKLAALILFCASQESFLHVFNAIYRWFFGFDFGITAPVKWVCTGLLAFVFLRRILISKTAANPRFTRNPF